MPETMCACGKPLHYSSALTQKLVEEQVAELGECIKITLPSLGRSFMVPRHFVTLHGVKAYDLPVLAKEYGFEEVK
jgi:hypothetical protein